MSIKDKIKTILNEWVPVNSGLGGSDMGSSPTMVAEMPHVEYLPNKFLDFKSELHHKFWFNKLVDLFNQNKNEQQTIIDNLLKDRVFVLFFKSDWNKLNDAERTDLKKTLPQ
jgi:hypothetical protein